MIKIDIFETVYGTVLKTAFNVANPIKKTIIRTECKVHKYINTKALTILKNDKYFSEYDLFSSFINEINEGAVWADQDFKSSNHFYNPFRKSGLYGRKNAVELVTDYYSEALKFWMIEDYKKSMFYLGAVLHLIQDMTIPQHANIKLLDDHHQFEVFVKHTYKYVQDFNVEKGAYLLDAPETYIKFNARVAIKIYKKNKDILEDDERFYKITRCALPLAYRTTAGVMVMFFKDVMNAKIRQDILKNSLLIMYNITN